MAVNGYSMLSGHCERESMRARPEKCVVAVCVLTTDSAIGRNQEKGGFDGAWCFWLRLKPEDERRKHRMRSEL